MHTVRLSIGDFRSLMIEYSILSMLIYPFPLKHLLWQQN